MVAYNIAISFAPVIFRTRNIFVADIMTINVLYDNMIRMIQDFDEIFVVKSNVQMGDYEKSKLAAKDEDLGNVLGINEATILAGQRANSNILISAVDEEFMRQMAQCDEKFREKELKRREMKAKIKN